MEARYSKQQLECIRGQALVYQCACPAQVSELMALMQNLYAYQENCIDQDDVDVRVHQTIAAATTTAYAIVEDCLTEVLRLEGWDLETLAMPDALREKILKQLAQP